jgi:hypothetical protein
LPALFIESYPFAFVLEHSVDHTVVIGKAATNDSFLLESQALKELAHMGHGTARVGRHPLALQLHKRVSKDPVQHAPRRPSRRGRRHRHVDAVPAELVVDDARDELARVLHADGREVLEAVLCVRRARNDPTLDFSVAAVDQFT